MIFKLLRATDRYEDTQEEYIEINTLEELEKLESSLRERESVYTLHEFPCDLVVNFIRKEITYRNFWME